MLTRSMSRFLLSSVALLAVSGAARTAGANPRPLPFSYIYETLAEGDFELEQYVDYVPQRARSTATGRPAWYGATQMQTEFEYGISNRLELGLYVSYVPSPTADVDSTSTLTEGNGIKQRLRLRLAEAGEWPVDVALYGEVVENQREVELEAKVILQRRIEKLRLVANLWAEREYYFSGRREWVLNPTAGAVYEVTPAFQPGVEYWMRSEYVDGATGPRDFNAGPHHFVGPTVLLSFGKLWWSNGVYLRVNDLHRTVAVGDAYGHVWLRTVIGVGF